MTGTATAFMKEITAEMQQCLLSTKGIYNPSLLSSLEPQHLPAVPEESLGSYITKMTHKVMLPLLGSSRTALPGPCWLYETM